MNEAAMEAHRRACEARHVLRLPLPQRRRYLDLVRERRGEAGWRVLCEDLAAAEQGAAPC